MSRLLLFFFFTIVGLVMSTEVQCTQAAAASKGYIWMAMFVGGVLNFCSFLVLLMIIHVLRQTPDQNQLISNLVIQLCQSSIRVGIGASARKALLENARADPKIARLAQGVE
ncbi:hypothetical protein M3Y94_00168800 [Aphelenchoides besseyi]|nr:hypothetical protein M3Y94_00168800 [Aphelenchoides besseyi]KAI6236998.1 hypothetical protein M3Y95_00218700 [Aphelenchoides besseyi]